MIFNQTNFLLESANEILGIFEPGHSPIVFASTTLDVDSTAYHEQGHKELCQTTSLGRYMITLSIAAKATTNSSEKQILKNALNEAIESCWIVQEGYATRKQMGYIRLFRGQASMDDFVRQLTPAYQSAVESFPISQQEILMFLKEKKISETLYEKYLHIIYDDGTYALAKAAMSIPMYEVIGKAEQLPNYQGASHIRKNSPDHRLSKIRKYFSITHLWKIFSEIMEARSLAQEQGIFRPIDEAFDTACENLCHYASLEYEKSDAISMQCYCDKINGLPEITEIDGRDIPMAQHVDAEWNSRIIVSSPTFEVPIFSYESLREILQAFRSCYPGAITTVVAEIALPFEKKVSCALHLFVPKKFVQDLQLIDGEDDENIRVLATRCQFEIETLTKIVDDFPHQSWIWIINDAILSKDLKYDININHLISRGSVFVVPLINKGIETFEESPKKRVLRKTRFFNGLMIPGSSLSIVDKFIVIPSGCVLFQTIDNESKCTHVFIGTGSVYELNSMAKATKDEECVAQVLAFGLYSTVKKELAYDK